MAYDETAAMLLLENGKLKARIKELEVQHKGLVLQNALLRQRSDFVKRLREFGYPCCEEAAARIKELEGDLQIAKLQLAAKRFT